jgi:hypothetical protein
MSGKDLLSVAGALWAFYGLALFTLLRAFILSERRLTSVVLRRVLAVVVMAFVVNFAAIALFQILGTLAVLGAKPPPIGPWAERAVWCVNAVLLVSHIAMSACAVRAISLVNVPPHDPSAS